MFQIRTKDNKLLTVSKEQAFEEILEAAMKQNENKKLESLDEFIEIVFAKLKSHMLDANNKQLYGIYFLAGYYYRIFLEKNNVEISEEKSN